MAPENGSDGGAMTTTEARVLDVKLQQVRDDTKGLKEDLREIKHVLENLVRIEEQQRDFRETITRAFNEINANRTRITEMEVKVEKIIGELPAYRELRRWVIAGIITGVGMLAASLVKIVIFDPAARYYELQRPVVSAPATQQPPKDYLK